MKKIIFLVSILIGLAVMDSCKENAATEKTTKNKHHLNIPATGIESMMEENTSKIIEGTQGSVVITIGEVTRKKVDISIKRNDKILDERLVSEKDQINFDYEGNTYVIVLKNIKKPLIGTGKAEIRIALQ